MQSDPIQEKAPPNKIDRIGYPLLPVILLFFYLPTLARGITYSDGGEIVAAIASLGVIHPTGYPIFTIIAHVFSRLIPIPIEPCIKIELLNALFGCSAAYFTAKAFRALLLHGAQRLTPDLSAAGLLSGFLLGISPLLWRQVRIPEVYPFHIFLVALAAYLIVRFEITREIKYIVISAIPLGVGLAHHVTMVYFLPALFIYLLVRRPAFFIAFLLRAAAFLRRRPPSPLADKPWAFPLACLLGALPLLSYAYLLWANKHTVSVPWGDVHDFSSLYNHVTGVQYRRYVASSGAGVLLKRFIQLHAHFDRQFIAIGTVFFFIGIPAFIRRLPGYSVFLGFYFLFNILHGIFYSVGDYANYFLPSVYCSSLFIGCGFFWLVSRVRTKTPERRAWTSVLVFSMIVLISCPILYFYAHHLHRMPELFGPGSGTLFAKAALGLGLAGIGLAFWLRRYRKSYCIVSPRLANTIVLCTALAYGAIALARAQEIDGEPLNGQGFGQEVSASVPPGSLFLTQGDGHLFTLWYFQHAKHQSLHVGVADVANIATGWYGNYLRTRFPAECDPLRAQNAANPIEFAKRCDSFEQRKQMPAAPWIKLDVGRIRTGTWTMRPKPLDTSLPRGTDERCAEEAFRNENATLCLCWFFPSRAFVSDEECILSADEGGVVPRPYGEIQIYRLIEDHIDERPVFERNAITFWENSIELNSRHWQGPNYQRLSADYALINRGRFNQIVYRTDINNHRPCQPEYRPLTLRSLRSAQSRSVEPRRRRPYRSGGPPIVLSASYLSAVGETNEDLGTRDFRAGQPVFLHLLSFERFYFDPKAEDKRGAPIHQGLRFCAYNPQGQRIAAVHLVSGIKDAAPLLEPNSTQEPGIYHIQACSMGELGPDVKEADPTLSCKHSILEYDFTVRLP